MTADVTSGGTDAYLENHWNRPLGAQQAEGRTPPNYPRFAEGPLAAQSCGQCHKTQYEAWKRSRHALAMGPGIMAQILAMAPTNRQQHQGCLRCHAPLAEQADDLVGALTGHRETGLHQQGLVCAACHVRDYEWHGPYRRDGSAPDKSEAALLPHGGWVANDAFARSEFCSACHQFDTNGFKINGKLLENTYVEWANSPYAEAGITCQSCHMPDRKHAWRGIHDLNATSDGIDVAYTDPAITTNTIRSSITVTNTGTGHHFPTYVTPRVTVEMFQSDASGAILADSLEQRVIARSVSLNLRREEFDTRLAAGASLRLDYTLPRVPGATRLVGRLSVEPDHFYKGFYAYYLNQVIPEEQHRLYALALEDANAADFQIHQRTYALDDPLIPVTVRIPAGDFIAGSDAEEREAAYVLDEEAYGHSRTRSGRWYDRERPRSTASTGSFDIMLAPVTNHQYAAFVRATGHPVPEVDPETWKSYRLIHPYERTRRHAWMGGLPPAGRENHPVVLVSRADAAAYAEWLSTVTGDRWRLPSALEWEKAARGTDGRRFPWGNEFDPALLNSHDLGAFDTAQVGAFPGGASPFGVLDMAGQVYEWTSTDGNPGRAVVKGGSWDDKGCGVCRPAARHARPVDLKHILIGFRLVREH